MLVLLLLPLELLLLLARAHLRTHNTVLAPRMISSHDVKLNMFKIIFKGDAKNSKLRSTQKALARKLAEALMFVLTQTPIWSLLAETRIDQLSG